MPYPHAEPVLLSPGHLVLLEDLSRSRTAEVRLVERARIVLLAADGVPNAEIARRLRLTDKTVRMWRQRYIRDPRLESLFDLPRSGRPSEVPLDVRLRLVSLACERPADDKTPFRELWTQEALQTALQDATGWFLSRSEVGWILRDVELRPHRVRMWLNSQDPKFTEKARPICELYTNPPPGVTVLCVDEKRLFAHERLSSMRPARPNQPNQKEFGYRRNGTSNLLGAFDVRTGEVFGVCTPRRGEEELVDFLETIAGTIQGDVVIIWDNLNIHCEGRNERWTRFNERHGGRFTFVYTPLHASWLNPIEVWFSILERRLLRHGSFTSVAELESRVLEFIRWYNQHQAHPFRWTFRAGEPVKRYHPPPEPYGEAHRGFLARRAALAAAA